MSEANTPAPAITEAPAPAPEAAAPAPAAVEASPTPAPPAQLTLLGDEPPKAADSLPADTQVTEKSPIAQDKPAEAPKDGDKPAEQPKEEASQSDEPAPLPTYEAFTFPEGVTADDVKLGEFTGLLAEVELAKGDHVKMQEYGQKLLDKHIAGVQEAVQRVADAQAAQWEKQTSDWKAAVEKDPEIGGNRTETTKANINRFIQSYGGSSEERAEFSKFMNDTKIGNYPLLAKMIARAGGQLAEGKPLPATPPVSAPKGINARINKMYSS